MNYLSHLIHDDMFLAVVSYLGIGLACLLYFFYRERKWERDLAQFEIKPVYDHEVPIPQYRPGTYSINSRSEKIVAVAALDEEMQVIAGQPLSRESAPLIVPGSDAGSKPVSATILPFRPARRNATSSSRHQGL